MTSPSQVIHLFHKSLAQSDSYRPPLPESLGERLERIPFPIDALSVELKRYLMALHGVSQAPLEICFASLFSVINHAAQALAVVKLPQGQVKPLSCFLISIADSGERKTRSDDDALKATSLYQDRLLRRYEDKKESYKNHKTVYEEEKKKLIQSQDFKNLPTNEKKKVLDQLKEPTEPRKPILVTADPTIEGLIKLFYNGYPFVMLSTSEGGEFFGSYANNKDNHLKTLAKLSRLWDGAPIDQVRKDSELLFLKDQRFNLHISVQLNVFEGFMGHGVAERQGFLSRVLLSAPKPLAGTRRWIDSKEAERHLKGLKSFHGKLFYLYTSIRFEKKDLEHGDPQGDVASGLKLREISCKAAKGVSLLREFYAYGESKIGLGGIFYDIKDFVSKSQDHVLRIAATLTLFENHEAEEVSVETIQTAIQLVNFYMSEHLFMRSSEGELDEVLLLKWLHKKYPEGVFERIKIMQIGLKKFRKAAVLDPLLVKLQDLGYVKEISKNSFRLVPMDCAHKKEAGV